MTQSDLSGHSLDVSLKQSIPLFGQKAIAEELGRQNKVTVEVENKKQILLLKHEVVRFAYRFAAIEEQAKHVAHRRENINLIAKFLSTRPFAAPAQAVEKNLILNRLREIEEKFLETSFKRESAWRALNVFLDLDSRVIPDVKWLNAPKIPDQEKLFSLFQRQNPDFEQMQSRIASAQLEINLAEKMRFPDIRLGGAFNEQTAEFPQRIYAGTLEFSLPILDRGGYAQRAALAEKEAITYRLEQRRRELRAQFEQTWTALQKSKERIDLYPLSLIASLETQMSKAEQGWKKSLVQVTVFLELENQVHEQANKVFDSQADYIEALSQAQLLAGSDFSLEGV
jgi:hypothetical protein